MTPDASRFLCTIHPRSVFFFFIFFLVPSQHGSALRVYADNSSIQDAAVGPLRLSRVRIRLQFTEVHALKNNLNRSASSTGNFQVQ